MFDEAAPSDLQIESYLGALTALAGRITAADDPSAVLDAMVSIAGEALRVDRALIYDVRLPAAQVVGLCEWLNPRVPGLTPTLATYPLAPFASVADAILAEAKQAAPRPFESHANDPDARLVATGAASLLHGDMAIASLLWHPFRFVPEGFMALVFNQVSRERQWSALDRTFIGAVAAQVSFALHKIQMLETTRAAEAAVKQSSARYRSLYDGAPSMFFTVDRGGRVLSANDLAAETLRTTLDELIGADVSSVVHPEDRERVAGELAACFASPGELRRLEFRKQRRDGTVLWVKETMRAQTSPDGSAEVLIVCDDVTDAKLVIDALTRSQSLDSLGLLAVQIAHDFNNLLVGVLTNAEILQAELQPGSPSADRVDQIVKAGHVARELVRRVMAFSGKPSNEKTIVDVDLVVSDVVSLLRSSMPAGVTVHLDLLGGAVPADATQIKQAVMNLVVNAVEAIDGAGEITVRTRLERDRSGDPSGLGTWMLEVSDTGRGIPRSTGRRVFDPLFTTKEQGRGLGLAAVAGVVKAHGGDIDVQSDGRSGSTFRIRLPVRAVVSKPLSVRPAAEAARRGLSVLVLDDDAHVRGIVASALKLLGHQPIVVATSGEALAHSRDAQNHLSCALIDLTMPGDGGIEVTRALREHRPTLPVVIMSGFGEERVVSRLTGGRSTGFLPKPFTIEELEKAIGEVVGDARRE